MSEHPTQTNVLYKHNVITSWIVFKVKLKLLAPFLNGLAFYLI